MKCDQMFEQILAQPGLYIGHPSLTKTFAFLQGYRLAIQKMNLNDESLVLGEFQHWVEKRFSIQTTHNWADIVLFMAGGDEHRAFSLTKDLWEEYKKSWD